MTRCSSRDSARVRVLFGALSAFASSCEPDNCWPLRVGETYEIELMRPEPVNAQPSCGADFDLTPGDRFRVRVDAELRTDECVAVSDNSLLESQLGAVTLDLDTSFPSGPRGTGREEYFVLASAYEAVRSGTLEEVDGQQVITSPGCRGRWSFAITSSRRKGDVLGAYVDADPRVFLDRSFAGDCSDGMRNCTDSWAVSLRVFQPALSSETGPDGGAGP